jgi:hypothetical protein
MLYDLAKSPRILLAAVILPLIYGAFVAMNTLSSPAQIFGISRNPDNVASSDAIGDMKNALAQERRLLAELEKEQSRLRLEVINRRKLHQEGQASKQQVQESEQQFVAALKRVHEMRNSVTETDIAIAEAVFGEKVNRLPPLPVNGYSETPDLARFNGGFKWSIREAPRIERYFSRAFGRRLPVTALGQSATHNRLNFDHRDSMDVALHPDSMEGKALIDHLRKSGIPYIAFRGPVAGASTGPHIHIGRPSGRLAHG